MSAALSRSANPGIDPAAAGLGLDAVAPAGWLTEVCDALVVVLELLSQDDVIPVGQCPRRPHYLVVRADKRKPTLRR